MANRPKDRITLDKLVKAFHAIGYPKNVEVVIGKRRTKAYHQRLIKDGEYGVLEEALKNDVPDFAKAAGWAVLEKYPHQAYEAGLKTGDQKLAEEALSRLGSWSHYAIFDMAEHYKDPSLVDRGFQAKLKHAPADACLMAETMKDRERYIEAVQALLRKDPERGTIIRDDNIILEAAARLDDPAVYSRLAQAIREDRTRLRYEISKLSGNEVLWDEAANALANRNPQGVFERAVKENDPFLREAAVKAWARSDYKAALAEAIHIKDRRMARDIVDAVTEGSPRNGYFLAQKHRFPALRKKAWSALLKHPEYAYDLAKKVRDPSLLKEAARAWGRNSPHEAYRQGHEKKDPYLVKCAIDGLASHLGVKPSVVRKLYQ